MSSYIFDVSFDDLSKATATFIFLKFVLMWTVSFMCIDADAVLSYARFKI